MVRSRRMTARQPHEAHEDAGTDVEDGWRLTPVAVLFGGNASGKSSFLFALQFMIRAIGQSHSDWEPDGGTPVEPFMLDRQSRERPSLFEVEFLDDHDMRFQYGFRLDRKRIVEEWLYAFPLKKRQIWFERKSESADPWYFGKSLPGQNRAIAGLTRPNSLFLSAAATFDHKRLSDIQRLLYRRIRFATNEDRENRTRFTIELVRRSPKNAHQLRALIKKADLGICDIQIKREPLGYTRQQLAEILDVDVDDKQIDTILDNAFPSTITLAHLAAHGDEPVMLPFGSESDGTRVFIAIAGPIIDALNQRTVLAVDELETSLHPTMVAALVRLFQSGKTNPHSSQLFFTSHNTSLLGTGVVDEPLVERDQIWFVEKDSSGESAVYPLTDFSPRLSENLERGYLQGRYGAIPHPNLDDAVLGTADDE